ncbi:MAG TPA: hypothetical protein VLJ82_16820, partial [Jatrophihabitans sp.]|nr:hypothetical protein [Jatrophihabitans sp.]
MTAQYPDSVPGDPPSDTSPAQLPTGRRLNRAAVVLWRSRRDVQLELGTRRIVVEDVGPEQLSALLWRPAGSLAARPSGAVPAGLAELVAALDDAGFLTRATGAAGERASPPARLAADLGALAAQFGDGAEAVLQARRTATVAVHGTSRLATTVAATLAAAGVGWIHLVQAGEVSASDVCPGGVTPADEGRRFAVAAEE